MKWYLAISIAEALQLLRERATKLRYGTLLVLLNSVYVKIQKYSK